MSAPSLSIRRKFSFAMLALFLLGLSLESLARMAWSDADLVMNPRLSYLRDDPTLLWTLRPNLDISMPEGVRLRTNSSGLRNEEIEEHKPEGTIRILSLGESTTWGHGVEAEEAYSQRLEDLLNRESDEFDVINAGVGGYTTWQSAVYLEEHGIDLAPDVVMIYHLHNDRLPRGVIDQNNFLYEVRYTDAELTERRRPFRYLLDALYRSHLYLGLRRAILRIPSDLPDFDSVRTVDSFRMTDEERRAALWRIHQLCQENGIRLVVLMPTYDRHPGHDYVIQDFVRQSGTLLIDLPTRKTDSGISNEDYYLDAVHPSVRGHALIADWIRDALEADGPSWWHMETDSSSTTR